MCSLLGDIINSLLTSTDGWSPGLLGAYITLRMARRTEFLKNYKVYRYYHRISYAVIILHRNTKNLFTPSLTFCVVYRPKRHQQMLSFRNQFHKVFQYHPVLAEE